MFAHGSHRQYLIVIKYSKCKSKQLLDTLGLNLTNSIASTNGQATLPQKGEANLYIV